MQKDDPLTDTHQQLCESCPTHVLLSQLHYPTVAEKKWAGRRIDRVHCWESHRTIQELIPIKFKLRLLSYTQGQCNEDLACCSIAGTENVANPWVLFHCTVPLHILLLFYCEEVRWSEGESYLLEVIGIMSWMFEEFCIVGCCCGFGFNS